jgi:GntR family transcriptional regulator, rspAB operon transcriptional repressor
MAHISLAKQVYDSLLSRLLSGQMPPGHVFNRRQVAKELGVSVAPILEAMLELEAEGLIETLPRKGTRVRVLTVEDLRGQLVVREALECQAARLYCGAPVERHVTRLNRLAGGIDAIELRSPEHAREEIRFHHYLVSLAEVPALTDAFERVMKIGLMYGVQMLHPAHQAAPRSSHVDLVNALLSSDADHAEAVVRRHIRTGKEPLMLAGPTGTDAPPTSPPWLN